MKTDQTEQSYPVSINISNSLDFNNVIKLGLVCKRDIRVAGRLTYEELGWVGEGVVAWEAGSRLTDRLRG